MLWYLIDRSKPGFFLSSFVGITGTAILLGLSPEMMPSPPSPSPRAGSTNFSLLRSNGLIREESIWVWTWIASVLFCSSVCFGNLGRRLALGQPGKRGNILWWCGDKEKESRCLSCFLRWALLVSFECLKKDSIPRPMYSFKPFHSNNSKTPILLPPKPLLIEQSQTTLLDDYTAHPSHRSPQPPLHLPPPLNLPQKKKKKT